MEILIGSSMHTVFYWLKWLAIVQLVATGVMFCCAYGIKVVMLVYQRHEARAFQRLQRDCANCLAKYTATVGRQRLARYKVELLVLLVNQLDREAPSPAWIALRAQLVEHVFLTTARNAWHAKDWYTRYMACQLFGFAVHAEDAVAIRALIFDPVALISMDAARLALRLHSSQLVDAMIDVYSKSRRVQQALYVHVLSSADGLMVPMIEARLLRDTDEYVKSFCYRLLIQLPCPLVAPDGVMYDFNTGNVDLMLSVMDYVFHHFKSLYWDFFVAQLQHSAWQVRARAIKLLGQSGNAAYIDLLRPGLNDPERWVQMNAEEALKILGDIKKDALVTKKSIGSHDSSKESNA